MSDVGPVTDGELLRALLESAPVRIAVFDRSGRLLLDPDPNPPLPTDQGVPAGANFFELYGNIPGIREAVQVAFEGGVGRTNRVIGGATYMGVFRPRRGPTGTIDSVVGVATVVHTSAVAEQALQQVQARERSLFNASLMGMIYWNEHGAITDANDAFLAMLGYTREDLAFGRIDWQASTPPEFRANDRAALDEIQRNGQYAPFEKEYVRKDGSRVNALVAGARWEVGSSAGVACIVDISERKRHEHERREAELTLRRVVEAAPLVLWSIDTDGTVKLSTGRGLTAMGLQSGELVGRSVYDLYQGVPEINEAIRRALGGEQFKTEQEVGGVVLETMFSTLRDQAGEVSGVLGISTDVTERRRAEVEQERLRAQLLQVQKLESLGLLAGGIAHDFNNILQAIVGGASTALMTVPVENPAHKDIENVIAAARRAAGLTRQMLAYSGKAHVEIRAIDLSLHVREITALLETTIAKKVQLRLELQPGLPAIEADVAQVQQIAMNLVINGAEAIGDQQGTVLVTTGTQYVDDTFSMSLFAAEELAPGRYVFLEVHDTGHGMDDATQSKIFDPFFTTKFTGRGLGLAAVLGIVRAHRGAIKVYSSPGRGTTFKVFFPAAEVPAEAEPAGAGPEFKGEGLVLVIDDDAGVRVATRRILEFFGFSVVEAPDGQAGVAVFAQHAAEIVLVIVDMTMPRMNGEETFRAIRRTRLDVPVVLTSGYNEIEATRRFTSKGLAGFLEKPFTPMDLAAKLAAILPPK